MASVNASNPGHAEVLFVVNETAPAICHCANSRKPDQQHGPRAAYFGGMTILAFTD
jgi:hypothetical protein